MRRRHFGSIAARCLVVFIAIGCQQPAADPSAANKDLVRQLYAAIDKNDFEQFSALMADDGFLHYVGAPDSLDKQATIELIKAFYTSFPDYTHQIDELVAEGDRVAVKITFRATHQAAFEGIPATGKVVTYTGAHIVTIANGKIRRVWGLEDNLGLMTQLGMTLAPAPVTP